MFYLPNMQKLWLSFLLISCFYNASAQKIKTFKQNCGIYYSSIKDVYDFKGKEINFYNFKPGNVVGSIGAQCTHWEAAFAAVTDSVQFYLQDIDTTYCNTKQASFAWNYYEGIRAKPMTSTFKIIMGNEQGTNLPDSLFDKILIINSFHEFIHKPQMLADIAKKLKRDGILYIEEAVAKKSGDLHGVCNAVIFLPEELIALLKDNGYAYVNDVTTKTRKGRPLVKVYSFKKT